MNSAATTGPQEPNGKKESTDVDNKGTQESGATMPPPTSLQSPGDKTEQAGVETPRRRRGILLGTRAGDATSPASDDEKSLSWMATQAVKALNAVKASQMEQAQAIKAEEESIEEEAALDEEEQGIGHAVAEVSPTTPEQQLEAMRALNAEEVSADAASVAVQSGMASVAPLPASPPPVQTATVGEPGTVPPAPIRRPAPAAATSLLPVRLILILGVLVMFGYAGYRYWFTGSHRTEESFAPSPASMGPTEPELGREMAAPAISVVPAPHDGGHEAESGAGAHAPTFAGSSTAAPQPTEPERRTTVPQATAVNAQSPTAPPEPAPVPRAWQPTAAPAVESAGAEGREITPSATVPAASEPPVAAPLSEKPASTVSPPSQPPVLHPEPQAWQPTAAPVAEPATVTSQPAMAPPARTEPTAKPVAPRTPAAQPAYPAGGYGYYPPAPSWQPYYRPGYPQAPARR